MARNRKGRARKKKGKARNKKEKARNEKEKARNEKENAHNKKGKGRSFADVKRQQRLDSNSLSGAAPGPAQQHPVPEPTMDARDLAVHWDDTSSESSYTSSESSDQEDFPDDLLSMVSSLLCPIGSGWELRTGFLDPSTGDLEVNRSPPGLPYDPNREWYCFFYNPNSQECLLLEWADDYAGPLRMIMREVTTMSATSSTQTTRTLGQLIQFPRSPANSCPEDDAEAISPQAPQSAGETPSEPTMTDTVCGEDDAMTNAPSDRHPAAKVADQQPEETEEAKNKTGLEDTKRTVEPTAKLAAAKGNPESHQVERMPCPEQADPSTSEEISQKEDAKPSRGPAQQDIPEGCDEVSQPVDSRIFDLPDAPRGEINEPGLHEGPQLTGTSHGRHGIAGSRFRELVEDTADHGLQQTRVGEPTESDLHGTCSKPRGDRQDGGDAQDPDSQRAFVDVPSEAARTVLGENCMGQVLQNVVGDIYDTRENPERVRLQVNTPQVEVELQRREEEQDREEQQRVDEQQRREISQSLAEQQRREQEQRRLEEDERRAVQQRRKEQQLRERERQEENQRRKYQKRREKEEREKGPKEEQKRGPKEEREERPKEDLEERPKEVRKGEQEQKREPERRKQERQQNLDDAMRTVSERHASAPSAGETSEPARQGHAHNPESRLASQAKPLESKRPTERSTEDKGVAAQPRPGGPERHPTGEPSSNSAAPAQSQALAHSVAKPSMAPGERSVPLGPRAMTRFLPGSASTSRPQAPAQSVPSAEKPRPQRRAYVQPQPPVTSAAAPSMAPPRRPLQPQPGTQFLTGSASIFRAQAPAQSVPSAEEPWPQLPQRRAEVQPQPPVNSAATPSMAPPRRPLQPQPGTQLLPGSVSTSRPQAPAQSVPSAEELRPQRRVGVQPQPPVNSAAAPSMAPPHRPLQPQSGTQVLRGSASIFQPRAPDQSMLSAQPMSPVQATPSAELFRPRTWAEAAAPRTGLYHFQGSAWGAATTGHGQQAASAGRGLAGLTSRDRDWFMSLPNVILPRATGASDSDDRDGDSPAETTADMTVDGSDPFDFLA